jgi:hypothetical protein
MSLPYHIPKSLRSKVSRRWNAAKFAKRAAWGADADTLRRRALYDARGQVVREGVTYSADRGETHWSLRRSVDGRVDQFDSVIDGVVVRTGGLRRLRELKRLSVV